MATKKPNRRDFVKAAGAGVLGSTLAGFPLGLPAQARTVIHKGATGKNTLLCIYLRGGADALNMVVPYTNENYYAIRPTISIPPETNEDDEGVIKITDKYGLNPALKPLHGMWEQKKLTTLLCTGSPHPTRSHFDAQDFMEYAAPGDRTVKDGWLNRFLKETANKDDTPLRAIAVQGLLPRALRGHAAVLAVPKLRANESEGLLDLFDDVYKGGGGMEEDIGGRVMEGGASSGRDEAVKVGRDTIATLRHFWDVVEKTPRNKKVKYPRGRFGNSLQTLAQVIRADVGLEVAALDYTGWDTHQGQGATDASYHRMLSNVAGSLASFFEDLDQRSDRVTVLVMTEFGRTAAENGNRGTDHGRGSVMLAMGGAVNGGRVIGDYGTLQPKELQDRRDLLVKIDFRSVFREVLQGVHNFDAPKGFFPLFSKREDLGLCKS